MRIPVFSRICFRHLVLTGWLTVCALLMLPVQAQQPLSQLNKMQAAYLFNFSKYTQWATGTFENNDSPVVICLQQSSPLFGFLNEVVAERRVGPQKREVQVKPLQKAKRCHIAYFHAPLMSPLPQLAGSLMVRSHAELTVSGHVITFFVTGSKLRFEVDLAQLRQRELTMSSEVLKLARIK